ncbi:MAG: hypothetical protein EOO42_00600 [Flavobacteriales bacterium]|nr:MAG: hypothetical protein EOO42_00600 [Flavobacteriales bacterium]
MKYLLFGGAPNVGKSESIYRLALHLLTIGFTDVHSSVPTIFSDFRAILTGIDKNGKLVRIIFNSATDTPGLIKAFKDFYDLNGSYDILVSSIRDDDFWPRKDFFSIMGISPTSTDITEIPLAKITRRNDFQMALDWYIEKLDKLTLHILANTPFELV